MTAVAYREMPEEDKEGGVGNGDKQEDRERREGQNCNATGYNGRHHARWQENHRFPGQRPKQRHGPHLGRRVIIGATRSNPTPPTTKTSAMLKAGQCAAPA